MTSTLTRRRALAASLLAVTALLTACGGGDDEPGGDALTTVVDVRTPAEFATGHVQGALNLDIEAADADQKIAGLGKDRHYLVYCHSGRRAKDAVARMQAVGLTARSGGGIEDMRAAGWTIGS